MRNPVLWLFVVGLLAMLVAAAPSFAQMEEDETVGQMEELEAVDQATEGGEMVDLMEEEEAADPMAGESLVAFGLVEETSSNQIVLLEHDYEIGEDIRNVYEVNDDTSFEEVTSLGEINSGDDVEIEFITDSDGKKIAKSILKYFYEDEPEEGLMEE